MASKKIKGITIEIGGDATELGKALEDSEKKSKSLQSELREIENALKFNPDNVELVTQKQKVLTEQVEETSKALELLKDSEKQVAAQFESGDIGEDQYRAFQREIITTESKLGNYEKKLEETQKTLQDLTDENGKAEKSTSELGEELDDARKSADKFDESIDDVGEASKDLNDKLDKVAVGVAAIGASLVALGKEAIDAFNEVDEGADNVIKATGATGEIAESLEQSFTNVSSTIVGEFSTIGSVLGEVNTRFGFLDEEAETATTKFLKFSEVTGMDAVSAVQAVSRAIESAGLRTSDFAEILDALTTAGQVTGVSIDTLANALTDNGAVMREMGYDTQTTIAMLAQFEKAGVDSNAVIRGMRTAISKWSKDGKDAKTEFEKLVKGIKDGTADAGEAYEVFGSKAGVELVDAIKSGRFEYEDMIKVIEESKDSLETTFEGTVDGGYELELTLQRAKVKFAELGETVLGIVVPILEDDLLPLAEKFIDYTSENIDEMIPIAKNLAVVFGTVFVTNKVATFTESVKSLGTTFKSLGTVLTAHPIGLLATGVLATAGAFYAARHSVDEMIASEYRLTDSEQALIDKISERTQALESDLAIRKELNETIDTEAAHNQNLWNELQNIVTANGQIKAGYEERASVITGLLADSLGIEIQIVDGQIQKYDELKASISEVINTKRAEALLEVNKESYTNALQEQTAAYAEYNDAIQQASESEKELAEAQAWLDSVNSSFANDLILTQEQMNALNFELANASKAVSEAKKAHEQNAKALKNAQSNYLGYCQTIQNYEGLMEAVASEDAQALTNAMNVLSNSFVTVENATEQMLKDQLKNFQEQYANMKAAVEKGMPGVSAEQVKQMGVLVQRAEAELDKLQPLAYESGKAASEEYATGMTDQEETVTNSGKTVAEGAKTGLGSVETYNTGVNLAETFRSGLLSTRIAATNAGINIALASKSGLGSISARETGGNFGGGFALGIEGKKVSAQASSVLVAQEGKKGFASVSARDTGINFAEGFSKGINAEASRRSVKNSSNELAYLALNTLSSRLDVRSPSRKARKTGKFFTQGFALGVEDEKDLVETNVSDVALSALTALGAIDSMEINPLIRTSFNEITRTTENVSPDQPREFVGENYIGLNEKLEKILKAIENGKNIVLDTGVLVGETTALYDQKLSERQALALRGV